MYRQVLDPFHASLGESSVFAALPLAILFVLLGVFRVRAWLAATVSLIVELTIVVVVYKMPAPQALSAVSEGAAFGIIPIIWIVLNAIWIYNMTVETGHFDVLRRSFARVSDDQRIQGVIVAFCFGALLEGLAGFGAPVAITSVMLIALGFRPLKAATVALVANTTPVAFGALAVPITTLSAVTAIPQDTLAATVGRQTPLLGVLVPFALMFIIDRGRGIRQTLPVLLVAGVSFSSAQFLISNSGSIALTDILASLLSMVATTLFLQFWHPSEPYVGPRDLAEPRSTEGPHAPHVKVGGAEPSGVASMARPGSSGRHFDLFEDAGVNLHTVDRRVDVARAYAPYLVIVVVFALAQISPLKSALAKAAITIQWPGLHILSAGGQPSSLPAFTVNWLAGAGTLLLFAGLITLPILRVHLVRALVVYIGTIRALGATIFTVMTVLALAYVMNASGQTVTLGTWMAAVGGLFAVISPLLGWLGVAVTGSDTSSNSLFGALQVAAATRAHLSPTLLAAANSSGGVLGKMISPQNLAIAAGSVHMPGREGDLLRRVIGWSVLLTTVLCLLVYLQSTPALSWSLP